MQIEEDFCTHLGKNGIRALVDAQGAGVVVSPGMEGFSSALGMRTDTLVALAAGATCGRWPSLIGGKLLILEKISLEGGLSLISISEASPPLVAELLYTLTGDELFILGNAGGRVFCMSKKAEELFCGSGTLVSLFDSSSSGALSAALLRCSEDRPLDDFLVSSTAKDGQKMNYGLFMRRLPAPGRLILCRLSIPSVAVVTQSLDSSGLIKTLLEESFSPAFAVDAAGTVSSMNHEARASAKSLWGIDPSGRNFSELVHPVQRKAMEHRHLQRAKGYPAPSRYSVMLIPSLSGTEVSADISVIPAQDSGQWIIFARLKQNDDSRGGTSNGFLLSSKISSILGSGSIQPKELLQKTVELLGAESGAYASEEGLVTVGDSRNLIDLIQSRAEEKGSKAKESGFYQRSIRSCHGISHIYLQGVSEETMQKGGAELLNMVGAAFSEYQSAADMRKGRHILALIRMLAIGFLEQKESTEGLLAEVAREAGAETAAVFAVSRDGSAMRVTDSYGIVGEIPEIVLDSMNTASWACLRGETAFYSLSPGNDLRFSPVFSASSFEMAAPFYSGTTPEGVILLAAYDQKGFRPYAGEILQLIAVLLSRTEKRLADGVQDGENCLTPVMNGSMERIIHTISALEAAAAADYETLAQFGSNLEDALDQRLLPLRASVKKLGFYSRWALWWLRISHLGAKPDQRWLNPVPLIEKAIQDFMGISETASLELLFDPPEEDIEVCTDGAFLNMMLYSLMACVLENTDSCSSVSVKVRAAEEYWTIAINASGDSIPGECLAMELQPDGRNLLFMLAWKFAESLGGTLNTFSNRGQFTNMTIRLRVAG